MEQIRKGYKYRALYNHRELKDFSRLGQTFIKDNIYVCINVLERGKIKLVLLVDKKDYKESKQSNEYKSYKKVTIDELEGKFDKTKLEHEQISLWG